MRIFISFSGERSRYVAEALRQWLPNVIQAADPWMSEDIDPGARWTSAIAKRLEESNFGILCVTPENLDAPWLSFEAGAIAKTLDEALVCPYLVDLDLNVFSRVSGPLNQFQAVRARRDDTLRLVKAINRALGASALPEERLAAAFERWWPDLEVLLSRVPEDHRDGGTWTSSVSTLGLESIHPTRAAGLEAIANHLNSQIEHSSEKEPARIWIVASSLVGLLTVSGELFDGERFLTRVARSTCDFRLLLTSPEVADMRAQQERWNPGHISTEINQSLQRLKAFGIRPEDVRLYGGSPTVFAIATSEKMLLNPYPYEREAHRCFSMIVRNLSNPGDIYQQFLESHFTSAWEHAKPLGTAMW